MLNHRTGWLTILTGAIFIAPPIIMLDPILLQAVAIPAGLLIGLGIAMVTD